MNLARRALLLKFFTLVIIYLFQSSASASVLLDRVVAVVNKEVITWSDLYKMMESEASEQVKAMSEEDRRKVFKENEAIFLEKLIDMRLQIQEAKRLGLGVTAEDVKDAIENIKKKYSLTDKALEDSLRKEGLTIEEYKKRLSDQILISQFVNQKMRSKIVVSDEAVKKYIDSHKESYAAGETFRLRQIFFRKPKDDAARKTLDAKASAVIERLKAGEDFSALAKEYSEDPSGKLGGDIGYVKKSYMAAEFIGALSKMNTGDFSEPFWTGRGLHIIKLDEAVAAQNAAEMKEGVKKLLADEQFVDKYKSYMKGLREKARIEIRL